ncbi:MAG: hypothetical protein KDD45_14685 [Bdellovibrionales bacterium]|nr:hypothetical protein [Bdellovibrionales bacterium]
MITLITSAVIAFGPEGNIPFYWVLNTLSLVATTILAYCYGYLQHKQSQSIDGTTIVHTLQDWTKKFRVVEYNDKDEKDVDETYVADENWLIGFRKIITKKK